MIPPPEPSKRPLGWPVSTEALHAFTAPGDPDGDAPFSHGDFSYVDNGALTLRFDRRAEIPQGRPDSIANVLKLPWGRFDHMPAADGKWVPLDEAAGHIWRFGANPIWEKAPSGKYLLHPFPAVRVGTCVVVPLPLVQLLARLPRAVVWVNNSSDGPLFVRWNGGLAILTPLPDFINARQRENFRILMPRTDSMDGALRFRANAPRPGDMPRPTPPKPGSWPPPEPIDD